MIKSVESQQLPAPDFQVKSDHTKVILFAFKKLSQMSKIDQIRACYQHASLMYVNGQFMTNSSLRKRLSIKDKNHSIASRIIKETIEKELVRPFDPNSKSKKHMKYVPFWA